MADIDKGAWVFDLCHWYEHHARDLPWRRHKDAYRIWLSEIMLQQTQVVTVIGYYEAFIKQYPTVAHLASANEDDVLTLWQGLGYYQRARNMHRCAKMILEVYDGNFPSDVERLKKLPGIGDYTAGAIASIAYNARVPAVDGNVQRLVSRLYELPVDLSSSKAGKTFRDLLLPLIPERASDFTQSMMDLGATICTPQNPKCDVCPILQYCGAFAHKTQGQYPVKTKKIKKKHMAIKMAIIRSDDKVLLFKQTQDRLLNGLWLLPNYDEVEDVTMLGKRILDDFMLENLEGGALIGRVKHIFTHLIWDIEVYVFTSESRPEIDYPLVKWQGIDELEKLALPSVIKKAIDLFSVD